MKAKILKFGAHTIYALREDLKEEALALAKEKELSFYPGVKLKGNRIYRDVYSGYMEASLKIREDGILTLERDEYDKLPEHEVEVSLSPKLSPVNIVPKDNTSELSNAKTVFIGGRGLGSKANYERLKRLAKKYGASCGCSRPVAMNGWESYDNFVGISGHILECDLVVTFGVSGAGPLIKGISKAKKIIGINNDKNALIFSYADYGIVKDVMEVIKYLEETH